VAAYSPKYIHGQSKKRGQRCAANTAARQTRLVPIPPSRCVRTSEFHSQSSLHAKTTSAMACGPHTSNQLHISEPKADACTLEHAPGPASAVAGQCAQVALLAEHLRRQQAQRPRGSSWTRWRTRWQHTGCAKRQPPLHNSALHYALEPQLSKAVAQATAAHTGTTAVAAAATTARSFAHPPLADGCSSPPHSLPSPTSAAAVELDRAQRAHSSLCALYFTSSNLASNEFADAV